MVETMRALRARAVASVLAMTTIAIAAMFAAVPAVAAELAGVKMADSLSVGGKALRLNGLGLRKKAIFKVYVGGLYLEAPSKDAGAVIAANAPKAVVMHFLRSVDRGKLVEAYKEGFEANAGPRAAAQKTNIDRFYGFIGDVKDGTEMRFAYVPGKGTTVSRDAKELGTIEGKDFAEALFSVWLGLKPPSADLKKGLLGG